MKYDKLDIAIEKAIEDFDNRKKARLWNFDEEIKKLQEYDIMLLQILDKITKLNVQFGKVQAMLASEMTNTAKVLTDLSFRIQKLEEKLNGF